MAASTFNLSEGKVHVTFKKFTKSKWH